MSDLEADIERLGQTALAIKDERDHLRDELEKAYRAIRGFYTSMKRGDVLDQTAFVYHSPTIAAACRFVATGELHGSQYFIGKPVEVLHNALNPERLS